MKVTRVDQKESYNITSEWINDFSNKLLKQSGIIEIHRRNSREKFATIEDKMADMKKRVGFDKVKDIASNNLDTRKSASACECDSCDTCSIETPRPELATVKKILSYLIRVVKDRHSITFIQLIHDCRSLPEYGMVSNKISNKKLSDYAKKIIESYGSKDNSTSEIEYVPFHESYQFEMEDMKAPYIPDSMS